MFLLLMSNEEWSDDEDTNIEPQPDRMFPPSDSESEEATSIFPSDVPTDAERDFVNNSCIFACPLSGEASIPGIEIVVTTQATS